MPSLPCHDVVELLLDLELDELEPDRQEAVRGHLSRCANCTRLLAGLQAVPGLVRGALDATPAPPVVLEQANVIAQDLRNVQNGEVLDILDDRVRGSLQRHLSPDDQAALDVPAEGTMKNKA